MFKDSMEVKAKLIDPSVHSLELYLVVNQDGQYLRSKGYGGVGKTWVSDIKDAKIYAKIGPARSRCTWFANNFKDDPPRILKLTVQGVEIINEVERIEKKKKQKEKAELNRKQRAIENKRKALEAEQKRIQKELSKLK